MIYRQVAGLGCLLLAAGCNQTLVLPLASTGAAAAGSSGNATTTGGPGSSASSGSSSGGSSTGNSTTGGRLPPFVDGGYVFCAALVDGGSAHWMCQPGTYLCDLSGSPGNCLQCLSDSDCADQALPTYDPNRPHCDVQSGVPGYQNFCQQCTGNADCTSNPAGPLCDLNPSYPPDSLQTSIDTVGFETCGRLQTDCRLDGGPLCRRYNQICNPVDGQCLRRSGACTTDQDCLGLTSETGLYVLAPYCVAGTCRACDGGVCPDAMCDTDAECGNPTGSASGLLCNLSANQCNCDDNSQCGGFWPVCLPFTANLSIGSYCGCDSDQECGDGGLVCLADLLKTGELTGVCGLPCSSPSSPLCAAVDEFDPICEPDSGYCEPCASDVQCQSSPLSGGPSCQTAGAFAGMCGCALDSDCPTGETCQGIGACAPALDRCSPASCPEYSVCDWDSGECLGMNISRCFDDYDCASQGSGNDPFCQNGACVGCRSSSDCVNTQDALYGYPYCCLPGDPICSAGGQDLDYSCQNLCQSDQDCFRVPDRPSCVAGDGGYGPHCGCGSDVDCVGNSRGPSCNLDPSSWNFGGCDCTGDSDCPAGASCQVENMVGYCNVGGYCFSDAICPAQYACDPSSHCRPRCDTGNSCQGPDQICDDENLAGQNGQSKQGATPGVIWCYSCLGSSDCSSGLGCNPSLGCGACRQDSDCPASTACVDGGGCQPTCFDAGCLSGQVCDSYGLAGFGPNVCYQCVSAKDCPNDEGCDSESHTCGTCHGPTAAGAPFDCPPDAVCSNYWTRPGFDNSGVCLPNCDRESCPAAQPICAVLPGLTQDHKYCFGCLQDSDCASLGGGSWCDVSPYPTFTCIPGPKA